ncbi:MAG TPA: ComEC/Rec2 family competence protein [Pseudolabrys sp.]|nr:ComEC/Rec2 family competence protein [Pseudolabrys sp.]
MVRQNTRTARPRVDAKTWSPEFEAAKRPTGLLMPDGLARLARRLRGLLREWISAEIAPGRLMPWVPVALGIGILFYFEVGGEPAASATIAAAIGCILLAFAARRRPFGFAAATALASVAVGFSIATLHTLLLDHPVLQNVIWSTPLSGVVELREERERSDRIVVRVESFAAPHATSVPERIRVAVRKGSAPPIGSIVELKAHLSPPLSPVRPGGYDFARDMYFQRIGASGYALGAIKALPPRASESGYRLRYAMIIENLRGSIDKRIRSVISGDDGSIASALITGKRDAISAPVNEAMYASSLAHVLSISGYHMAVVAGIVFFVFRAIFAFIPTLTDGHPIKKWAAFSALVAATFYLLLSGAEVATQRSFIMVAIVLIGVILNRPTLTFRTLAVAALAVMVLSPQAVVHPSFQMSFAATLALVAMYQNGPLWGAGDRDDSIGVRVALWGVREVIGLVAASLVAGLATTPYAAYHFHRLAPYGVLANLLAMPIVSAVVMPMGILGVATMPFGFDAVFWKIMAEGIEWMNGVALWVTSLPGAIGRMHAFGTGPLLLGTAGLLIVCMLRTPLRWSGTIIILAATCWALLTPMPDVLIAPDGSTVAFRGSDGRLTLLHGDRDDFVLKEWLAADADPRKPDDPALRKNVSCDAIGCVGRFADGRIVAMPFSAEALAEDCTRASIIISQREAASSACRAVVIDRRVWRETGALSLRWTGERFALIPALDPSIERPWTRRLSGSQSKESPLFARAVPADANPHASDLRNDD